MAILTYDRAVTALGVLLIAAGVLLNPWVLDRVALDGRIDSQALRAVIWIGDVVLIAAGLALVRYRPRVSADEAVLAVVGLLVPLLLLELGLRGRWWEPPSLMEPSETLGWVPRANESRRLDDAPFGPRDYSTGPMGFRRFGDPRSDDPVVLFIGDSFTHATEVGDGEAYYDVIAREHPGIEVFAFGARGYGTLQEYLALDGFIDRVDPDLIVLQLTSNDLVTNDFDLEARHWAFNNQQVRPYLIGDTIVHRFPATNPLFRHSALARFIAVRIESLRGEDYDQALRDEFARNPEIRERALRKTERILRWVQERAGETPIVAFQVDEPAWIEGIYPELTRRLGIRFIEGVPDAVERAKRAGQTVDFSPHDGHWNATGHAIAGRLILEHLLREAALPLPD